MSPSINAIPYTWHGTFPYGWPYLTCNTFSNICGVSVNYGEPTDNPHSPTDWRYCKTDYVEKFCRHSSEITDSFVLVTGNSDYPIDEARAALLDRYPISHWFAINVTQEDPRITPIPIGIKNEGTPKQGCYTMRKVMDAHLGKWRNVVANFNVATNAVERMACLSASGSKLEPWKSYEAYLCDIATSRFTLAPNGNGIDTHRAWDALYLRSVPVVTRSLLWDSLPYFPAVVLDSWEDFDPGMLTDELYAEKVNGFDYDCLYMYRWLVRMEDSIRVS
jgi:hypothetical protein